MSPKSRTLSDSPVRGTVMARSDLGLWVSRYSCRSPWAVLSKIRHLQCACCWSKSLEVRQAALILTSEAEILTLLTYWLIFLSNLSLLEKIILQILFKPSLIPLVPLTANAVFRCYNSGKVLFNFLNS